MPLGPPYSNPPIVEALLDIQVELPGGFQLESFRKCHKRVKKDFPELTQAQQLTTQFSFGPELSSSATARPAGFVFKSADKKQWFQARGDGFTYNRLEKYPGWDAFVGEANRLWGEFRRVAHPVGYKRIALRYINRVDCPGQSVDLPTYFLTNPQVGPSLPQRMANFFFQVQLPLIDIESGAIITQTAVPSPKPEHVSVVLDIDIFRTENLPPANELWSLFETLRVWKNKVFEGCITNATRELIQ